MATNTLTTRSSGETILDTFFNDFKTAFGGDMVGRDTNGVPASGKSLGTAALPWGAVRANSLIIGGSSLDLSQIASPANRVLSGQTRSTSNQPSYIVPAGVGGGASFTLKGATTNLVVEINAASVSFTSDIVKSTLTLAPSTNNTCLVNDTAAADQAATRTWGEAKGEVDPTTGISQITIDTIGTEISSLDGKYAAFKINDGANDEYFMALVDTTNNRLINIHRGFFYDSAEDPVNRIAFANNDVITLMSLGYIFGDSDGSTIDVTYTRPTTSFTAPSGPATGDYWFDMANSLWKRYDGATFQIINRTFIGYVVLDDTDAVAARSEKFDARYKIENTMDLELQSSEIVRGKNQFSKVSVAGNELLFEQDVASWNITTDLAATEDMYNATEQISRGYYHYISDVGETIISDIEPYYMGEDSGYYHPHNPWRMVGASYNDASSNLVIIAPENNIEYSVEITEEQSSGTNGHTGSTFSSGAYVTRLVNTVRGATNLTDLVSSQAWLVAGDYEVDFYAVAYRTNGHKCKLVNVTDTLDIKIGVNAGSNSTSGDNDKASGKVKFRLNSPKLIDIQHRPVTSRATNGFGNSSGFGDVENYSGMNIRRVVR